MANKQKGKAEKSKNKTENSHSRDKSLTKSESAKATIKAALAEALTPKVDTLLYKMKDFDTIKKDYDLVEENINSALVLHKMSEILEFYLKIIQQILQPEEFHALYEGSAFDDDYKAKLFDLYKKIIIAHRELLKAVIMNDDKNSISAIQYVHEEIKAVKPQMLDLVSKLQQSWKIDSDKDVHKGTKQYFG